MRLNTRILCVALLIVCMASSCASRRGAQRFSQCGNGHDSLLDCYLSKTPHAHHGHHHHGQGPCAEQPCDVNRYQYQHQRPVPPPAPSEPTTQIIRPRRPWVDRSGDSLEFSIPLPSRWIGSTEPAAEASEPEETIPWNNAPVATGLPSRSLTEPDRPQVVGYEYGLPVELQSPNFEGTSAATGHSTLNYR